ncbi:MAG TPA: hypothetical protein VFM96_11770, partial [Gaiellaceae bacterium]|nr:hypothetical protein [Gaiellaceae bacterium]
MQRVGPVCLPDMGSERAYELSIVDGQIDRIDPVDAEPTQLCLPPFVELHVHPDRAFCTPPRPPRSLADAIEVSRETKLASSESTVRQRASRVFELALSHGCKRVRGHVDVDPLSGERALRGVLAACDALVDRLAVEVVAFATAFADLGETDTVRRLRAAVEAGAGLLGASPRFHSDPRASLHRLLDLAAETGRPVDVHIDERSTADGFLLEELADATLARDLLGRVTASHACALAVVEEKVARRTIEKLA